MIKKFKLFENHLDDLTDIFQDLELDYPDIEISVKEKERSGCNKSILVFIENIQIFDLSFANDLCDYINKCSKFGFEAECVMEICIAVTLNTTMPLGNNIWRTVNGRHDVFTSGKAFISRLGREIERTGWDSQSVDLKNIRSIEIYFTKKSNV